MSDKPNTRKELFLSAILSGDTSNLPEPQTREEEYLYAIAVNGGGGGGSVAYKILGAYDTEAELRADHPTGNDGDAYLVGDPSHVFVWLVDEADWHDAGAFTAIAGPKGDTGDRGPRGYQGPKGDTGEQGIQGEKGDTGERGVDGEAGPAGRTATVQVGTVSSGTSPSIENVGTNNDAIFNFVLPKGDKGDKGDDGEDGQDGKSFDIKGQYPSYAALIAAHPTGSAGEAYFVGTDNNPDLYIWLTDDATWYNNGKIAGVKGDKGDKGDAGFSPIASVSKSGDTATIVIRDETGQTTAQIKDGEKGDPGVGEPVFNGTQAQWDGLTLEQKLEYQTGMVVINDDYDDSEYVKTEDIGTAAAKDSTDRVSPNNTALVESQSVYSAINTALSSIYTPRGDITCAELTSDLLIAANVGNIYETTDSGTTTALFLQGAGVPISAGSNVGIINAGEGRILFNLMANAFDLTDYQKKDLTTPITVDGVQKTTVEDALGGLNTAVSGRLQEIGALPTASVDNLYKTYLLISAQTGYDKGAIYQCQSDGQNPATYSWVKISSADVPIATSQVAGIVKPDDTSIHVDANGVLSVDENYRELWADNPIGSIIPYGGSTAPDGWFICDGTAISRTTYPELFAVIGTSFGAGDGSTTFNLPDMRESVPKGAGLTGHTVGAHLDADGLAVGEFIDDRIEDHNHQMDYSGDATIGIGSYASLVQTQNISSSKANTSYVKNARFGATTEVKSVGVNYIIKAKMIGVPADFLAKVDEAVEDVYGDIIPSDASASNKLVTENNYYDSKIIGYSTSQTGTSYYKLVDYFANTIDRINYLDVFTDANGHVKLQWMKTGTAFKVNAYGCTFAPYWTFYRDGNDLYVSTTGYPFRISHKMLIGGDSGETSIVENATLPSGAEAITVKYASFTS